MIPSAPLLSAAIADSNSASPIVTAVRITKQFPGVRALDDASLSIAPGKIVALLGQNGAGKSTLIQILAGVHAIGTYSGAMTLGGNSYRPVNIAEAERLGVALVPQEVNVVPELSVAENICLNADPTRWGVIDVAMRLWQARSALRDFNLDIDPAIEMSALDLANQQLVIIARALSKSARLLILDEPTAALTESESLRLFDRMRALKERGVSIIFVSHRLAEVFTISDRIVVMRDGRVCGDHATGEVSRQDVVSEMVGDTASVPLRLATRVFGDAKLEVRGLTVFDSSAKSRVRVAELDLVVHHGEIVGLFGLVGAGCIEAALAIYGAWLGASKGEVKIDGMSAAIAGPRQAVALGLGLMAQDRRDCLIQDQSISDNIVLASLKNLARFGILDIPRLHRMATDQVRLLNIKTVSIGAEVRTLSGGNQQKVQIARWLAADARILILIDPTRGVDVGARNEIKQIWSNLSKDGHAILIASTDAEELVDVCDGVVVMKQGRRAGELRGDALNERELLRVAADD
jgi:ABC-type sugar transport system ATPase subunit